MQTKAQSFIEACTNVACGFILSYLVWLFIVPLCFDIETNSSRGFWVTCLFTVTSLIRSYVVRRFFNKKIK